MLTTSRSELAATAAECTVRAAMTDALNAARDRLVFALDLDDPADALTVARDLRGELRWIKVATRLYTRAGPPMLAELRAMGFRLFLDLKFHDIPAQVEGACRSAAALGAELMTVHACGGRTMLEAAVRGAARGAEETDIEPTVLAVTVLTSLDDADLNDIGVNRTTNDQVLALAQLARAAGCGGVVASPQELAVLRRALPSPFAILTPGIRPRGWAKGDQKRVTTPADAIAGGADWLVIGRPIRDAKDRSAAARAILEQMAEAQTR
jgi:orotidine-5'-phosphate decarboxylase